MLPEICSYQSIFTSKILKSCSFPKLLSSLCKGDCFLRVVGVFLLQEIQPDKVLNDPGTLVTELVSQSFNKYVFRDRYVPKAPRWQTKRDNKIGLCLKSIRSSRYTKIIL